MEQYLKHNRGDSQAKKAVIKQGWLRAVIGLVLVFPIVNNSVYVLQWIARLFGFDINRLLIAANNMIFALLAIFLVRKFIDRKSFFSLGFSSRGYTKDMLFGLVASLLIMGAGFLILVLSGDVRVTSFNLDIGALLYWALALLCTAILEEVSFRGYLLGNMMSSMNNYVAVGIISLLFGLGHGLGQNASVIGIANCTLMGVFVGLYYVQKRNLWLPIVFHTGWNFFQGIVFGFRVSGRSFDYSLAITEISENEWLTGGSVGFEGSLILTVLIILAIILFKTGLPARNVRVSSKTAGADN